MKLRFTPANLGRASKNSRPISSGGQMASCGSTSPLNLACSPAIVEFALKTGTRARGRAAANSAESHNADS
jgi:hypothetical protein